MSFAAVRYKAAKSAGSFFTKVSTFFRANLTGSSSQAAAKQGEEGERTALVLVYLIAGNVVLVLLESIPAIRPAAQQQPAAAFAASTWISKIGQI